MSIRAHLAAFAVLAFPGTAVWAQAGRRAPALPLFQSDRELRDYLHQVADQRDRELHAATCKSVARTARRRRAGGTSAVVLGRVTDRSGTAVSGALVAISPSGGSTTSANDGRYQLRVPPESVPASQTVALKARHIGYGPVEHALRLRPGDSVEVEVSLCAMSLQLAEVAVAGVATQGAAAYRAQGAITNTQHAGVDEGGIVKLHGDHLVILRRGRLFTIAIG